MRFTPFFMAVLLGCSQEERRDEGTVVGNPGDAALRMGSVEDGEVVTARTFVAGMALESCSGTVSEFELDEEVDFLDDVHIELPNGEWCGVELFMEDSLYIETVSTDDEIFLVLDLEVEVLEFESTEGFSVEGDSAILEWGFPGWLSMEKEALFDRFGLEEEDVEELEEREDILVFEVTPDDEEAHDEMVDVFAYGSGLYGDDGDGRLSDEERREALLAAGSGHPVESTEEAPEDETLTVDPNKTSGADAQLATGPGCAQSESSLQWAVFFPLMLLGWRRGSGPR